MRHDAPRHFFQPRPDGPDDTDGTLAQANVLVTDLSKDQISIRGDFTGETLLLFGAIDPTPHGPVDGVVVVLRGPGESVTLRKKQKSFGIWVNQQAYRMGPCRAFWPLSVPPLIRFGTG